MDQAHFLAHDEFLKIREFIPNNGWRPAKVYSLGKKKTMVDTQIRKSGKNYEKRKDVIREMKKIIMKPCIKWFKENIQHFQYCWMRNNQTEWIRYQEGDFFRPHQDFEKYICNGMIPFVFILGLQDVEQGGGTKIGDTVCMGSAQENGAVFFQANLMHESLPVEKGVKLALKLEFFIFVGEDFIRTQDDHKRWLSLWSIEELKLMENFFMSKFDFDKKMSKTVTLGSDLARESCRLNMSIADPTVSHTGCDILFPGFTVKALHDIFSIHHFIHHYRNDKIVFGSDPIAWEFINTKMSIPENFGLYVGIWSKKNLADQYVLQNYYNRKGEVFHSFYYMKNPSKTCNEYVEYPSLKIHILDKFLNRFDHYDEKNVSLHYEKGQCVHNPVLKNLERVKHVPSDNTEKPSFEKGKVTVEEKEFCNEEDAGYMTYRHTEYKQYFIQIRFFLYRLNG